MYQITVQRAVSKMNTPTTRQLKDWAKKTLQFKTKQAELLIRIVDNEEMLGLNSTYRHKNKTTNVLSFPFDMPDDIDEIPFLGDIVICAPYVNEEATQLNISSESHWAHMVVHGILHLLGYDHVEEKEAAIMESEEMIILKNLGYANPYCEEKNGRH